MKLNIKHTLLALLASSLMLTSCLEDQEDEYKVIGGVPTVIIMETAPKMLDIGESFDLKVRYYSPNAVVTQLTVTESISSADGTEKSMTTTKDEAITGFKISDSYEFSYSYTASNAGLENTDIIIITFTLTAANGLSSSQSARSTIQVKDITPTCPEDITGTYLATTVADTPFDGTYDNTASPYTVTITENEDGTYAITDVTGGLYGEHYADIYSSNGVQELPADLDRAGCEISATDVPEDPGFQAAFGDNFLTTTGGVIDGTGTITYDFTNDAGDSGSTTLVKQ